MANCTLHQVSHTKPRGNSNQLARERGWEFSLWFFVRIARFWKKRMNRSFAHFLTKNELFAPKSNERIPNPAFLYIRGSNFLKNQWGDFPSCDKLLKDPNSKISPSKVGYFWGRKACEYFSCNPKISNNKKCNIFKGST